MGSPEIGPPQPPSRANLQIKGSGTALFDVVVGCLDGSVSVNSRRTRCWQLFLPPGISQLFKAIERCKRDQRHDQPRPDRRSAIALYGVHQIWGFYCHGERIYARSAVGGNRERLPSRRIGERITVSSGFWPPRCSERQFRGRRWSRAARIASDPRCRDSRIARHRARSLRACASVRK